MNRISKPALFIACVAGVVAVCGASTLLYTWLYPNNVVRSDLTRVADEAVVFDVAQGSLYRMRETNSAADLRVTALPESANAAASSRAASMVSHLSHPPDLSRPLVITDDMRNAHRDRLKALSAELFTPDGPYMQNEKRMLPEIIADDDTPRGVQVDGGISNLTWSSGHVHPWLGRAVLRGQGDAWASFASLQGDSYITVTPVSRMNFTVYLRQVGGAWKVGRIVRQFQSGSGP
jgi:hypothetical protein